MCECVGAEVMATMCCTKTSASPCIVPLQLPSSQLLLPCTLFFVFHVPSFIKLTKSRLSYTAPNVSTNDYCPNVTVATALMQNSGTRLCEGPLGYKTSLVYNAHDACAAPLTMCRGSILAACRGLKPQFVTCLLAYRSMVTGAADHREAQQGSRKLCQVLKLVWALCAQWDTSHRTVPQVWATILCEINRMFIITTTMKVTSTCCQQEVETWFILTKTWITHWHTFIFGRSCIHQLWSVRSCRMLPRQSDYSIFKASACFSESKGPREMSCNWHVCGTAADEEPTLYIFYGIVANWNGPQAANWKLFGCW